jgi:hypothetical protein
MDLAKLDKETRCFALVGQFFHTWAKMEQALHNAIGLALGIDATKVQILAVNTDFENKLFILSTLIDANPAFTAEQRKEHFKTIETFRKNAKRNMIAHSSFEPDESGVRFEKVKARKKFEPVSEVWDMKKFEAEATTVNSFRSFLEQLGNHFKAHVLTETAYRNAAQTAWYGHQAWYGHSYYHGMSPALMEEAARQSAEAQNQSKSE